MRTFTCLLFVALAVAVRANDCNVADAPMEELPMNAGAYLNIFTDMVVSCSGKLSSWQFFSEEAGTVYLDIWRPVGNDYELVGKNEYTSTVDGNKVTFDVPAADQISVEFGDRLGIHYPQGSKGKIIPYLRLQYKSDDPDPTAFGLTESTVSAFQNQNTQDNNLPVGKKVTIKTRTDKKKTPALHAMIDTVDTQTVEECQDTFTVENNKHVMAATGHLEVDTVTLCEEVCLHQDDCTSFDYDNKVHPWRDTRCWIHTIANDAKEVLDLNEVDHHTRAPCS